jgi:hypothetical protein
MSAFEMVRAHHSYTPRNLRRRGNTARNGTGQREKSIMFRAVKKVSDQFIHQSASTLEKMGPRYERYCRQFTGDKVRLGAK